MYTYIEDLALNNLQGLICYKTQRNQILYNNSKSNYLYYIAKLAKIQPSWVIFLK